MRNTDRSSSLAAARDRNAGSRQVRSLEALCGVKLTQGPRNALKLTDADFNPDRLGKKK